MDNDIPLIQNIRDIAPSYDTFFLDIWGVLHDGIKPYDGVIECLEMMKEQEKEILLLSNSPDRSSFVTEEILAKRIGIPSYLYDYIVTSGESAWHTLKNHSGQKAYTFWQNEYPTALEGHNIHITAHIDEADFMLASLLPRTAQIQDYEAVLQKALARNVPLFCANPDKYVYVGPDLLLCAGALGDLYQEMGGLVHWFGKPHMPVYNDALGLVKTKDKSSILAIGDSIRTDVIGANNFGIDVLWNLVGIHWANVSQGGAIIPSKLELELEEYGAKPTALLHGMAW